MPNAFLSGEDALDWQLSLNVLITLVCSQTKIAYLS